MRVFDDKEIDEAVRELSGGVWRREVLGKSVCGREIPMLVGGQGEKVVVYVGAHHGMERLTAGILTDFAAEAAAKASWDECVFNLSVRSLLDDVTFYIIPMLNPDGVHISLYGVKENDPRRAALVNMNDSDDFSHWQANADGVDLNHNYDAGFEEYRVPAENAGITGGGPTRYAGKRPESEPETAALSGFLRALQPRLSGVLTLHTQGEEIFCACDTALSAKCRAVGRRLQALTGYKLKIPQGLAAYGGLTDWCIESLRRPAFTLECGKGQNPLPPEDEPEIYARLRPALFTFPLLV